MSLKRRLLPATLLATYSLILLGIYTAAVGAGLSCDARWPLCDGAVFGLFPANWPSFVEWFHRLVAIVTGVMILGSWWVVWRDRGSRRSIAAMSVAAALLPIQIWLGAETVFSYEVITLVAHFLAAMAIFTGVILGTVYAPEFPQEGVASSHWLLPGSVVAFVPFVVLTPQFLLIHTGAVQVAYYGLGLAVFAALVIVTAREWTRHPLLALLAGTGALLLTGQLLAGRLVRSPTVHSLDWAGALATLIVLGLTVWIARRNRERFVDDGRASPNR